MSASTRTLGPRTASQPPAAVPHAVASPGGSLPSAVLEACRGASLQLGGPRLSTLGVTSTVRGEGRSTIALALAEIQSQDYGRGVVLLDLDLESPRLSRLGAASTPGIAELADGIASVDDALQELGGGITLVSAGAPRGHVTRIMAGFLRANLLQAVGERFDVVVADLPPLLGSSCGQAPAAAFADLLLVIRSGVTPLERIREATVHLSLPPAVLLNGTSSRLPPWLRRLMGC